MRTVALILTAVISCCVSSAFAASSHRVAVSYPSSPFAYTDSSGNLTGFDVELAHALCAQMKDPCEIIPMRFDDIIPALTKGTADFALANMVITQERAGLVHFSESYHSSHSVFVERVGAAPPIDLQQLDGKRIAAQSGTIQEQHIKKTYGGIATIQSFPTLDELFAALDQGTTDLILIDNISAQKHLSSPEGVEMEQVGEPLTSDILGAPSHIAVSKSHPDLPAELNSALKTLRNSGEYSRIHRKYFNTAF